MSTPDSNKKIADSEEWASRGASNVRLGLILGAVVLALFLIAIWKYRPL
jgi:hypothetical protein